MSVLFSPAGHRNIADSYTSETFQSEEKWMFILTIIVLMMEVLFVVHTCYFIKMVQVSWFQLTYFIFLFLYS